MIKSIVVIILLSFCLGCKKESTIILENAKIINVETGEIEIYDLSINGTKISKISKESINGTNKIDLKGKYIMPSLWDMHIHSHGDKSKLKNFFNHGILGVRDLGAFKAKSIDSIVKWKLELDNDPSIEIPDIIYAGYINNDSTCYEGHRHVNTYSDLIESASYLKKINSSFYKVHNCFPDELLPDLDSLATVNNFVFGGHIPQGIDPIQYVKQFENINSIEHMSVILRGLSFRKNNPLDMIEAINTLDGPYLDSLAFIMNGKNISLTPNLLSEAEYIKTYPEEKKELGEGLLLRLMQYTKRFSNLGVNILAGTDTGSEFEAGKSLLQELDLLSKAGLSNLQVLQSTTINADKANRMPSNLINENSTANFIILHKNPIEDLLALKNLLGIVHKGNFKDLEISN